MAMAVAAHPAPAHGLTLVRSDRLLAAGIPHAFSTRPGGISKGPFASLNLGQPSLSAVKDDPDSIAANWTHFLSAADLPPQRISTAQVHGTTVGHWSAQTLLACADGNADALVTTEPGVTLVQRVADCMPVLLATADGRAVGVVHAGWRGLVGGVIEAALAALRPLAGPRTPLLAAIGPCISAEAFEVGEEVATAFAERWPDAVLRREHWPRPHVDLPAAAVAILTAAGLADADIDRCDLCTVGRPDLFFSHRRDGPTTGRMAAAIAVRPHPRPAGQP
jgi:polyphenol oxidase